MKKKEILEWITDGIDNLEFMLRHNTLNNKEIIETRAKLEILKNQLDVFTRKW